MMKIVITPGGSAVLLRPVAFRIIIADELAFQEVPLVIQWFTDVNVK